MRRTGNLLLLSLALLLALAGCGSPAADADRLSRDAAGDAAEAVAWEALEQTGSMERQFAERFSVDYYAPAAAVADESTAGGEVSSDSSGLSDSADDRHAGEYALVTIPEETNRFLLVPEGQGVPAGLPDDVTALQMPLDHIYLAASSAMDFWRQIGALDKVTMTSTTRENWSMPEVLAALDTGALQYVGKYSAPDYEQVLDGGCRLAVESTMIHHSPETQEKLEALGIPVMVERSSYETHPLGRMEWIRLYGLLADRQEEADEFFAQGVRELEAILSSEALQAGGATLDAVDAQDAQDAGTDGSAAAADEAAAGKSVAFFYITSNGAANVRKPGDYVSRMIAMAGGRYVFSGLSEEEDNALSTVNLQMEQFYSQAKDADILIYNSSIDGELKTVEDLLGKSALFAGFKAVKSGDVWCTGKNMFQETTCVSTMIWELHQVIAGEAGDELQYLHRLQGGKSR